MLTELMTTHHDWDGPGPWWPIFPLLWFALLIAGAVFFTHLRRRGWERRGTCTGEAKLAERFAAGEIDAADYRERLAILREGRR